MEQLLGNEQITISPEMDFLRKNKQSGFNYRRRRQDDWTENYTLYRDRVVTNRLTQRQSVNLPIMKQMLQSVLKDIDDMPVLYFENLDNDKEAEVFQNEYWKYTVDINNMEIQDIIDKKNDFFFGRTFDQMQICDGYIKITVQDPEDILIDRYTDPSDIDSARFLIHTHIFVPLATLEENPDYDKTALAELKTWHGTNEGLIKSKTNMESLQYKNQKMVDMGLQDVESPVLGETYIELSLHFVYRKEEGEDEEQLYLYVEGDDMFMLMKKRLEEVIGVTEDHYWRKHLPYNSWAEDVDRQDFWTDGKADTVRTSNKIVNAWYSQLVENRTLRNMGMNYYDATVQEGWQPSTFEPIAFGWYPLPGKPADVFQKVDIPDLADSLPEMQFVIEMAERATGATATQQGVQNERQITLGEVQLALGEAKERIKGISKYYTKAWEQRGQKFLKFIEAAPEKLDAVKIYKKGRNTNNIFSREIEPKDFMTAKGYHTKVWSQDEKNNQDTQKLEKINAAVANIPGNQKLQEIYQRKLLEFADLAPDEINEVMQIEEQKRAMMAQMNQAMVQNGGMQPGMPGQAPQPAQPAQPPMNGNGGQPINHQVMPGVQ